MAPKSFSVSVRQFTDRTKAQMRDVFAESVQDTLDTAQLPKARGGRMPVHTGALRNSLASGLNGSFANKGADSYIVTLSGLVIGDIAQFAWTAPHARRQELGFSGTDSLGRRYEQPGNHFLGAAVAQFPQRVEYWAARVKT